MQRSAFLTLAAATALVSATASSADAGRADVRRADAGRASSALANLEVRAGGRLGVFAFDSRRAITIGHRQSERFPMCSTFKLALVGAVLARVDRAQDSLERHLRYTQRDLLGYSPVTGAHVATGSMSVAQLCAAAIEDSDNTAANLLLASMDGPPAVTAYLRSLGDGTTRLDRNEPALNSAIPGDPRDTTTPHAMARLLQRLCDGDALKRSSRARLRAWLIASTTGAARLRAGVPASWVVGDKTGTGDHGTTNDVAFLVSPKYGPMYVAAYYTGSACKSSDCETVLADVGRIIATAFA